MSESIQTVSNDNNLDISDDPNPLTPPSDSSQQLEQRKMVVLEELLKETREQGKQVTTMLQALLQRVEQLDSGGTRPGRNSEDEKSDDKNSIDSDDERQPAVVSARNNFSQFAVFLASIAAALLAIGRLNTTRGVHADHAISVCWMVALILALFSSIPDLTFPERVSIFVQTKASQTLLAVYLVVIGSFIWVWVDFPSVVAIASTTVSLYIVFGMSFMENLARVIRRVGFSVPDIGVRPDRHTVV